MIRDILTGTDRTPLDPTSTLIAFNSYAGIS